jgi:hypothetical protein
MNNLFILNTQEQRDFPVKPKQLIEKHLKRI